MARMTREKQIENLTEKQSEISKRLKNLENKYKEENKKRIDRRNYVAGSVVLEFCKNNPEDAFSIKLNELISDNVKSKRDRTLFDLKPLLIEIDDDK